MIAWLEGVLREPKLLQAEASGVHSLAQKAPEDSCAHWKMLHVRYFVIDSLSFNQTHLCA